MRIGTRNSSVLLAIALVLGLVSGIVPAFASHGANNDTANVDVVDVLSGTLNKTFNFRVNHAAGVAASPIPGSPGATAAINCIRLSAPAGYAAIGSASLPTGWTASILQAPAGQVSKTFVITGGTLAHNTGANFLLRFDVPTKAVDSSGTWLVNTSDNGCETTDNAQATGSGLVTRIKVLAAEVDGLQLTAPAGVTDGIVTQDQSGITAVCAIRNFGNATRSVTATLTGSNMTVNSAPAAQAIAPGAAATFTFGVSFGNAGGTSLSCNGKDGTVADSTPFNSSKNVTVLAKRVVSYVANSLAPRAIKPSLSGVEFTLKVNISGAPAATINKANTDFSFAGLSLDLATPNDVPANAVSNYELKFQSTNIPNLANGSYNTTLNFVATDDNGAPISFRPVSGTEAIRVDALIPFVDPSVTVPATQVPGQPAAATDGQAITFGGTVQDTDPVSNTLVPCGTPSCSVVGSRIRQYDGFNGGAELASIPVTVTLSAAGNLGGSYSSTYAAGAQSGQLEVTVQDEAGNRHTNMSPIFEIDIIDPTIESAAAMRTSETADGTTVQRDLLVTISECVLGAPSGLDFSIAGGSPNAVVTAEAGQCSGPRGKTTYKLTVANDFPDDGSPDMGSLSYMPRAGVGAARPKDRVGQTLADKTVGIVDKIPPLQPIITAINGAPASGGNFYTNSPTNSVTVTNKPGQGERAVKAGYQVRVTDEDGTVLGSGTATGPTINVAINLGATILDGPVNIRPVSLDTAPDRNSRLGDLVSLILDRALPTLLSAVAKAGFIELTFSESLVLGRNHTLDFQALDNNGDELNPNSISGTGNVRLLNIGQTSYDPTQVDSVAYLYQGGPGACSSSNTNCRYEDVGKNMLQDFFTSNVSAGA